VTASHTFGENLRQARRRAGLTQEELAHAAELHPTEISRLERAVRDPRLSTMCRLAAAMDLELAVLVRGI
jgi:transcriptional regulator with XRE-family HTH domain